MQKLFFLWIFFIKLDKSSEGAVYENYALTWKGVRRNLFIRYFNSGSHKLPYLHGILRSASKILFNRSIK